MMTIFAQFFSYPGPKPSSESVLSTVLTIAFGVLGGISIIVLVISGMRFTLSRGNPEAINKLRSTIIYSAVGLVVALGATALIQFVTGRL